MNNLFEPTLSLSQFKLPPQDIKLLSFCESNKPQKVRGWVDHLKMTQVKATGVALYQAVPEVNHLITDAKTRYEILEILWPAVQQCLHGLAKEFLQQPLILPESVQKTALIAQALQKHLLDGYTLCAKQLVSQRKLKPALQSLLLNCIYRAMTASSMLMLRSSQLYTALPPQLWQRLHALYQTAEYYDLHKRPAPLATAEGKAARSIQEAYGRILVFSSIRPNQLSQNDLFCAYRALESWVRLVKILPSATENQNNLYLVDLNQDSGPVLKNRFAGDPNHRVLELDFQALVGQLSKMSGDAPDGDWIGSAQGITVPTEMPDTLLEHMLDCWSNSVQRNQDRRRSDVAADACIGLIDCHFHLCGSVEFEKFINPREELEDESFLSGGFDALVSSLTSKKDIDTPKAQRKSVFDVTLQNISSGGYCILWRGELPNRIESGELIGIREQGRRVWSIGVVRWIRQLKHASQLGVQLLSNQPVPYGAAVMYDMGGYSDYMRAIHIPAPAMPDQPATLLTATVPFQAGGRVRLKQDDVVTDVRLEQSQFSTSKLKLFSFATLSDDGK